jgi:hypothetical protein
LIELVEELVIGGDENEYAFHALFPRVVADEAGQIFAMDGGNRRIQVYGPDGNYLRTIGRSGNGPGEFSNVALIARVGNQLATHELSTEYLSLFSVDGTYQRRVPAPRSSFRIIGDAPGFLVQHTTVLRDIAMLSLISGEGEMADLIGVKKGDPPTYPLGRGRLPLRAVSQVTELTEAHGDVFYLAGTEGYEVAAFNANRELTWVLRLEWPQLPLTEDERRYVLGFMNNAGLPITTEDIDWPSHLPALAWIRSDGEGRLYVFPAIEARREPADDESKLRPVDVYDKEGNLLLNGVIKLARWEWQAAVGNLIYGTRVDPATGEWQLVRHRLVLR